MGLSVNVIVYNKLGNTDLALLGSGLNHGEWVIGPYGPPKSISANNLGQWATQSDGIWTGTQGWVRFYPHRPGTEIPSSPPDDQTIYIEWDAPYSGTNSYQCTAPYPYVISADTRIGNEGGASPGFYAGDAGIVFNLTGASGQHTCVEGYVWRGAFPNDFVCVTPADRKKAADQNAAAAGNHLAHSANCKLGFVWREASGPGNGDDVCVSEDDRQQVINENLNAKKYSL